MNATEAATPDVKALCDGVKALSPEEVAKHSMALLRCVKSLPKGRAPRHLLTIVTTARNAMELEARRRKEGGALGNLGQAAIDECVKHCEEWQKRYG